MRKTLRLGLLGLASGFRLLPVRMLQEQINR